MKSFKQFLMESDEAKTAKAKALGLEHVRWNDYIDRDKRSWYWNGTTFIKVKTPKEREDEEKSNTENSLQADRKRREETSSRLESHDKKVIDDVMSDKNKASALKKKNLKPVNKLSAKDSSGKSYIWFDDVKDYISLDLMKTKAKEQKLTNFTGSTAEDSNENVYEFDASKNKFVSSGTSKKPERDKIRDDVKRFDKTNTGNKEW